jgi:polyferredoxin
MNHEELFAELENILRSRQTELPSTTLIALLVAVGRYFGSFGGNTGWDWLIKSQRVLLNSFHRGLDSRQ